MRRGFSLPVNDMNLSSAGYRVFFIRAELCKTEMLVSASDTKRSTNPDRRIAEVDPGAADVDVIAG